MAAVTEDKPKRTLAPRASKKRSPEPRAHEWQPRLRELFREWRVMLEDFGMNKSTLARYAVQAKSGDAKAIAKIEPVRQALFTFMGLTKHMRWKRDENTGAALFVTNQHGDKERDVEERSIFGMRTGYDMYVEGKARRPWPGCVRDRVDEHFYSLCPLLEFIKTSAATKLPDGRTHPAADIAAKAHANAIGAGPAIKDANKMDKAALRAAFESAIANTSDDLRRDSLKIVMAHVVDGEKAAWDGLD